MPSGVIVENTAAIPVSLPAGSVTISTGDIEIGAVELKDGATDTRAVIGATSPLAADPGLTVRQVRAGTLTDRKGILAAANTSQQLMAVNATRRYLFIMNPRDAAQQNIAVAESLWINFTDDAAKDYTSIELQPGEWFCLEGAFVSTEKVTVIATTINHRYVAKEA